MKMKTMKKVLLGVFLMVAMVITAPMIAKTDAKAAISTSNFGIWALSSNQIKLYAVNNSNNYDVCFNLRTYSGTSLTSSRAATYSSYQGDYVDISKVISIKENRIYKYRVRLYNKSTGRYGAWSAYKYLGHNITQKGTSSTSYSGRVKLQIRRLTGVSKYKIYVSTTDKNSGYHLSKTVKCGSGSTVYATISSYVRKHQTNYIKIVPLLKNGKTATPDRYMSIYVY